MIRSRASLVLTLAAVAATSLVSLSPVAAAPSDPRDLDVGSDIMPGWVWASGGPDGCTFSTMSPSSATSHFTTASTPELLNVPAGAKDVHIEGCGTVTHVDELPKRPRKRIVGEGEFVVGAHLAKRATYKAVRLDTFGCEWETFRSFAAADRFNGLADNEGLLKVPATAKVVLLDGDCTWKRVR